MCTHLSFLVGNCYCTKMRTRLTLAAAILQSTHTLQPLVQRCCAESLAGCAGGLAKQLAVYPLDRAATRLETKKGAKATNVQQAYRGAGVLMLFALPYAIAFHVPFVLVDNALPVGDAAARASIAGFLAALAAAPVGVCVEINQCVGCSLSHFSAMTLPCWLRGAVRNRHRHAIEQAARRWRGGRNAL